MLSKLLLDVGLNAKLFQIKQLGALDGFGLGSRLQTGFAVSALDKDSRIPIRTTADFENAKRRWIARDSFDGSNGRAGVTQGCGFHALMLWVTSRKCDLVSHRLDSRIRQENSEVL